MHEMKDSGIEWIGEIPKDWDLIRLKYTSDCLDWRRQPVDASNRRAGDYPYWGAGSIQDYVDDYLFDEELVLLGEDGAPFFDPYRPVAFVVTGKIWVNNHIHVLKVKKNYDCRFLMYSLNSVDYGFYINGSVLNKLTQSKMNNIVVCLPSLETQSAIADFLEQKCTEIDVLIADIKAQIETLGQYKQSVISEAVTKGLNPDAEMKDSGIEWIGEIPKDWDLERLQWHLEEINVKNSPIQSTQVLSLTNKLGVIPYEEKGNLGNKSKENYSEYKLAYPGTIIANSMNIIIGSVGLSNYFGCVSPVYYVFKPKEKENIRFLNYYFQCTSFQKELRRYANGILEIRLRISADNILKRKIPFPSREEQARIVAHLDDKCAEIDSIIADKEEQLTILEDYKKSLIYEYVTGKKEAPTV